jgi:hypothetical protein
MMSALWVRAAPNSPGMDIVGEGSLRVIRAVCDHAGRNKAEPHQKADHELSVLSPPNWTIHCEKIGI